MCAHRIRVQEEGEKKRGGTRRMKGIVGVNVGCVVERGRKEDARVVHTSQQTTRGDLQQLAATTCDD